MTDPTPYKPPPGRPTSTVRYHVAQSRHLDGSDLTPTSTRDIARFAAYVLSTVTSAKGDMTIRLGVPHDQIPHLVGLLKEVGGITFEVTVRKVPFDELPQPGW